MDKRLIFFVFICIQQTGYLHAQWTKEDSVWLDDVVSGKKAVKINPEFQKAIEDGTFINTDKPMMEPLAAPPILPISKDFDIQPTDTTEGKSIDYSKMPPAVFALYKNELNLGPDTGKILKDGAFAMPNLRDKNRLQVPNTPVSVAAQATNIYNEEVKDGQKRGGFVFSTRLTFSLNDILMGIFNKTERNKRRNRKKANAWKQYKDYPEHLEWKPKERQ